jgi:hypothetical protein
MTPNGAGHFMTPSAFLKLVYQGRLINQIFWRGHVIKILAGLILSLFIGSACRWFGDSTAWATKLVGALLIVSITVGYLATDKLIAARVSSKASSVTRDMCGGPTGDVISGRPS